MLYANACDNKSNVCNKIEDTSIISGSPGLSAVSIDREHQAESEYPHLQANKLRTLRSKSVGHPRHPLPPHALTPSPAHPLPAISLSTYFVDITCIIISIS